jgi:hypothetical protein
VLGWMSGDTGDEDQLAHCISLVRLLTATSISAAVLSGQLPQK